MSPFSVDTPTLHWHYSMRLFCFKGMTRRPRRQWRFRLRLIELALLTASGHTKAENGGI